MKRKNHFCLIALAALIIAILPQAAFASEQGAVGYKYWDDNKTWHYKAGTNFNHDMILTSGLIDGYGLGTIESGDFVQAKDISAIEIIITKNGREVGHETAKIGDKTSYDKTISGINFGVGNEVDESGMIEKFDGTFWFKFTNDAPLYYTDLAGTYKITISWTNNGKAYNASISSKLSPYKTFGSLAIEGTDANGYPTSFWGDWEGAEDGQVVFEYNDLEAYYGAYYDEVEGEWKTGEVVRKYFYSDPSVNGLFDFAECNSAELATVFTQGDPIKFSEKVQMVPLCVHPDNITSNMIGKSCTLTFKNGNLTRQITIKITKADTSYLEEGKLYAISELGWSDFSVTQVVKKSGDNSVGVCLGENSMRKGNYENWITDAAETEVGKENNYVFARYSDGKLWPVELAELSDSDKEKLELTCVKKDDGVCRYRLEGIKRGEVKLTAASASNMYVSCKILLPYLAFFSTNSHTEDAYMQELHYKTAKEKNGNEAYFYLMARKYSWTKYTQDDLKVQFQDGYYDEDGKWQNVYYDEEGVTFTPIGEIHDSWENADYYVWKMTMTDEFSSAADYQDYDWKKIYIYAGEKNANGYYSYGMGNGFPMHDATEILEDEQLYWFNEWNVKIEDEKIALRYSDTQALEDYAQDSLRKWTASSYSYGYFAVKKDGEYYAVNENVSGNAPNVLFVSKAGDYKYCIDWRHTGRYTLNTNFEGKQYYLKMTVVMDETGIYSKNEPDEKWILDDEEFYFNDAYEKSVDGSEAYFYLISNSWNVNGDCEAVFVDRTWNEQAQEYIYTEKSIDGLSIEYAGSQKLEDKTYYSWKIKVSRSYDNDKGYDVVALRKNGEVIRNVWMRIYDSLDITEEYGNINGDYRIDVSDVLYLKRYIAGWYGYRNIEKRIADLNRDGLIDKGDVMILERHIAGWTGFATLPVTKTQTESA